MSIKIHHGAPGSYKTSGAVMDDFIPCVLSGRVVITNVRGLTLERVKQAVYQPSRLDKLLRREVEPVLVFPDVLPDFQVIAIDTTERENRDKLARWFHWAPKGAFLLIDEAQSIFPQRWAAKDLAELDYPGRKVTRKEAATKWAEFDHIPLENDMPGRAAARRYAARLFEGVDESVDTLELCGVDAALLDWCPANWADSLDMHRHFGWDITLTTPNIKKLRSDVREAAEGAYKHRNLALIGWGGRYNEGFHDAQDNGLPSNIISLTSKKISSKVWGLYDSTSTGTIADTLAGIKLWKDPKILFLLGIVALALYFAFRNPLPAALGGKKANERAPAAAAPVGQAAPVPAQKNLITGNVPAPVHVGGGASNAPYDAGETDDRESAWRAVGYYKTNGKYYVMLRREGVTRTIVNPKGATYDNGAVAFQLDGKLVAGYTGSIRANSGIGKL